MKISIGIVIWQTLISVLWSHFVFSKRSDYKENSLKFVSLFPRYYISCRRTCVRFFVSVFIFLLFLEQGKSVQGARWIEVSAAVKRCHKEAKIKVKSSSTSFWIGFGREHTLKEGFYYGRKTADRRRGDKRDNEALILRLKRVPTYILLFYTKQ